MADITAETAAEMLEAWVAAEKAIATGGQSYTISTGTGSRSLTRASLPEIRRQVAYWRARVQDTSRSRRGPGRLVAG